MCLIWSLFYMLHWWYVLKQISVSRTIKYYLTFNTFLRFKTVSKPNLQIILNTSDFDSLAGQLTFKRTLVCRTPIFRREGLAGKPPLEVTLFGWQEVQIQSYALAPNWRGRFCLKMGSGLSRFNESGNPLGKVTGRWGFHEPRLRQRQGHRAGFERRSV